MPAPKPVFDLLTRYHLARQIDRWGWAIGAHSYGNPLVLEPELASLTIGRFCSIGPNVTIVLGNHRADLVTTYPFKAIAKITANGLWAREDPGESDHDTRGDVVIGDEVWLAANCTILSGVTIGSGAVVGAGAVVSRDVPPYGIVAGNPARLIRHRFAPETIDRLLRVSWWSWPEERIAKAVDRLVSPDIGGFLEWAEGVASADR